MKVGAILVSIGFVVSGGTMFALTTDDIVSEQGVAGGFSLFAGGHAAAIFADTNDWPGVLRAAGDLRADVQRVSGLTPQLSGGIPAAGANVILIGTVGKSSIIDRLVRENKIDVSPITGKWESFFLQVVPNPFPGVDNALVICGSDKRGTIYGIYDLSEQIGVSPWYWWADVPPKHHDQLFVKPGTFLQGPPSVKYRGIFINDESPDLTEWVREKFGTVPTGVGSQTTANYGRQVYTNIFELLLRIKANYMWPAMWNNRFSMDDPQNAPLADMYRHCDWDVAPGPVAAVGEGMDVGARNQPGDAGPELCDASGRAERILAGRLGDEQEL